jgi:hypothetical protein
MPQVVSAGNRSNTVHTNYPIKVQHFRMLCTKHQSGMQVDWPAGF